MDVPIGRHWAHLPGLLAALEALAAHVEKVPRVRVCWCPELL